MHPPGTAARQQHSEACARVVDPGQRVDLLLDIAHERVFADAGAFPVRHSLMPQASAYRFWRRTLARQERLLAWRQFTRSTPSIPAADSAVSEHPCYAPPLTRSLVCWIDLIRIPNVQSQTLSIPLQINREPIPSRLSGRTLLLRRGLQDVACRAVFDSFSVLQHLPDKHGGQCPNDDISSESPCQSNQAAPGPTHCANVLNCPSER